MRPPPRYSVSPLPSISTRPGFVTRPITFSEVLSELLVGYGLAKRRPPMREGIVSSPDVDSSPRLDFK